METSSTLLMRVCDTGDPVSWREFRAIHEPLIVASARKQQVNGSAALDVAQEAFVRLLKALPGCQYDRSRGGAVWHLTL